MNYALLVDPPTPPSIEDSARHMGEYRCLNERERVKARARAMRVQLGLPPLEALR